jgi:hypothetical protein
MMEESSSGSDVDISDETIKKYMEQMSREEQTRKSS